jgi:DNA-binding NarL/FixJ family response regulator
MKRTQHSRSSNRSRYVECSPYGLTASERKIIEEMARRGESQQELADRLNYSVKTINGHLWNVYYKMKVHSSVSRISSYSDRASCFTSVTFGSYR